MGRLENWKYVCFCTLGMLAIAEVAGARTLHVGGGGAGAYASVATAVAAADDGDTIVLSTGRYTGAENSDVSISQKRLTIRSEAPNNPSVVAATVIDCGGGEPNPHRAFDIGPETTSRLTLEGITVVNGYSRVSGGAILCDGGQLEARRCVFTNNHAVWWGGAVSCTGGDVTLIGCTFRRNGSQNERGGAVGSQASRIHAEQCAFQANTGSAVQSYDGHLTLVECTFEENTGQDGAAVYSHVDSEVAEPTELRLTRCAFVANTAEVAGGALYVYDTPTTVEACTFSGNAAGQDGGAMYNYRTSPVLRNCAFVGNAANQLGGAVMNWYNSDMGVIHCTFAANDAAGGGAVASVRDSHILISHSILWNNTAVGGANLYLASYEWGTVYSSSAAVEYSDLSGGQTGVYVEPGCTLEWGTGNLTADPLFTGPLQGDYHLSVESPCMDAGDPNFLPEPDETDLDGNLRYFGPAVDMGAYEFQGLGPVYRFWSPISNEHFYTLESTERDWLIREHSDFWTYEGIGYYTYGSRISEGLAPVYRFWSPMLSAHFWTIDEQERDWLLEKYAGVYVYEGIAFYAYPQGWQPLGTLPVYRFWSRPLNQHFYTADEQEKDSLIAEYPDVWSYEGVAWYAYARFCEPKPVATYTFSGAAEQARYSLTLGAFVDGVEVPIDPPEIKLTPTAAQMRMTIDFGQKTTTLDRLHIQAEANERSGTIQWAGGPPVPFTISVQGNFDLSTRRGPYEIDPKTGVFADFSDAPSNSVGKDAYFTYSGTITLNGSTLSFNRGSGATQFELKNSGTFEDMDSLPGAVSARVPFTFQWHRQYVKDTLAEVSISGQIVQLYIVYAHAATDGLWPGQVVK